MPRQTLYLWKQAPFLRLVIPFMAGILLQWYSAWPVAPGWILFSCGIAGILLFNRRAAFLQYKFGWVNGVCINILFLAAGLLMAYYKDVSHQQQWLNRVYHQKDIITATLEEPLSEKANSFKAVASVQEVFRSDSIFQVTGRIIIYFRKDSAANQLRQLVYGSQVVFSKSLQVIKNAGNPGDFNYERYAAFQGIYQQVFLETSDYRLLISRNEKWLTRFLFAAREKVLKIIAYYIPGKKEAGLAEALLVGYKDDLDKTLVQSYSNTGVVHIIAISGMHMGLIYWLLNMVLGFLKKRKQTKWLVAALTIAGLWMFSLLAGGGPSILRSAVMFTCIVIGESAARKTFIYNSLAASAFILLCINPFWLWDAGFQLSYAAVLSIVVFMKPVYNWCYFKNKLVDNIWKLVAVSLAAQVLTTPVSIYHFHQFPVYFLFTNLLAVPLSSIIVLLEIALCAVSFIPPVATFTGVLLSKLISVMNGFIEHMENLPFSLWNNLQVNLVQVLLLYGIIAALSYWLMKKSRKALWPALFCLLFFSLIRSLSFIDAARQQQLIVYNIPKHRAIDFVSGRNIVCRGDSDIITNYILQQYYLNACRTALRAAVTGRIESMMPIPGIFIFNNKKIALIDEKTHLNSSGEIGADLVIVSGNAPVNMAALLEVFHCPQIVFDGSNSPAKVNKWKAEAAKLGLSCFYTVDNGAFVMKMD
jgi:competence protein ComEC